ncbi:MAG: tetratricopeptide repeat protein [Zavarzinella sp.]
MRVCSVLGLSVAWIICTMLGASAQDDSPQIIPAKEVTSTDEALRDAQALYGLGLLKHRADHILTAKKILEEALLKDQESLEIRKILVDVYVRLGRNDLALAVARVVMQKEPEDYITCYKYSNLLTQAGDIPEAVRASLRTALLIPVEQRPSEMVRLLDKASERAVVAKMYPEVLSSTARLTQLITTQRKEILTGNGILVGELELILANSWERNGDAQLALKDFRAAIVSFREANDVCKNSKYPDVQAKIARLYWQLAQVALAQESWQQAYQYASLYVDTAPVEPAAYRLKMELLRKLNRERDVLTEARRFAAEHSRVLAAQLVYAEQLSRQQPEFGTSKIYQKEAESIFLRLAGKEPTVQVYQGLFRLYTQQQRQSDIIQLIDAQYQQVEEAKQKIDPLAKAQLAAMLEVLRTDREITKSLLVVAISESQRTTERSMNTIYFLASMAEQTQQLELAERLFRQCLATAAAEKEAMVYSALLSILMKQRKHLEVVLLCETTLNDQRRARNTNKVLFYSNLALAQLELGKFQNALDAIEQAVRISSDTNKVIQSSRKILILSTMGKSTEAIAFGTDLLKKLNQPEQIRTIKSAIAQAYGAAGKHVEAEELLRSILETDPGSALTLNNLGYQLAVQNSRLEEAEELIRKAIQLDNLKRSLADDAPENAAYLDSLAWVLFRRGKLVEADDLLKKALNYPEGKEDPTVWDHFGDVSHHLGRSQQAKTAWETAHELLKDSQKPVDIKHREAIERKLKLLSY